MTLSCIQMTFHMQGGEQQGSESEESSQIEDDGTTLEDIKVKNSKVWLLARIKTMGIQNAPQDLLK